MLNLPFDLAEAQKSNILISGTNSTGKSRLACGIASLLRKFDWQVVAFDNSGVYRDISDIGHLIKVYPLHYEGAKIPRITDFSVVYDLSLQTPSEQVYTVNMILQDLWENRVIQGAQKWTLVLLEEMHLYARNVRGALSQNLLRIMTVGRNQKIRVLGVTVDLALIDPAFIRLCGQRYHGRLGIEENSKRKFRAYYGGDWLTVATELRTGDFIYYKDRLRVVNVPLFEPKTKPQAIAERPQTVTQKAKVLIKRLLGV